MTPLRASAVLVTATALASCEWIAAVPPARSRAAGVYRHQQIDRGREPGAAKIGERAIGHCRGRRVERGQLADVGCRVALDHDHRSRARWHQVVGHAAADDATRQRRAVPGQGHRAVGFALHVAHPRSVAPHTRFEPLAGHGDHAVRKQVEHERRRGTGPAIQQLAQRGGTHRHLPRPPAADPRRAAGQAARRHLGEEGRTGLRFGRRGTDRQQDAGRQQRRQVTGTGTTISFEAPLPPQAFWATIRT